MFDRYQRRANRLPGMMIAADDISYDQPYNPGNGYQSVANYGPAAMAHGDDPRVPYSPMVTARGDWQNTAASGPQRMMRSDDIRLGRVGRRSGSLHRSVRGLGNFPGDGTFLLGDVNCAVFDADLWLPPIIGYVLDQTSNGTLDVNAMTSIFGPDVMTCADKALSPAGATGTPTPEQMLAQIGAVVTALNEDPERLQKAAARMRKMGWWNSSNWHFYWCYLSGSKPLYKNPVAYGVVGLVGVLGYVGRKKRWFKF